MSVSDSPDNEEYDSSEEDYDSSEWAVNAYGGRLNVKPAAPHIPPAAPGPSTKDYLWGAAMALCVALVPNTLSLLVTLNPSPLSGADKLFVVSLLAFGAASVSLLTFGSKAVGARDSSKLTAYGYPLLLFVSGIAAAAYFIVVIGLGSANGLGAGLAETLDGSLSPCIYLLWAAFILKQERASRPAIVGVLLVLVGLFVMGMAPVIRSESVNLSLLQTPGTRLLVGFGVLGAIGTAFSLWLVRSLVRKLEASLGFAVMLRYGGVALAFLLGAILIGPSKVPFNISLQLGIAAFSLGAVLINGAYFAAIRIESEISTVAAMASIPLVTFAVEGLMHAALGRGSSIDFTSLPMWMGVSLATVGIALLQMRR